MKAIPFFLLAFLPFKMLDGYNPGSLLKVFDVKNPNKKVLTTLFYFMAIAVSSQNKFDPTQYVQMTDNPTLYVAIYEVTNGQYREFLEAIKKTEQYQASYDVQTSGNFSSGVSGNEYWTNLNFNNYPVVSISHEGAVAYCKWLTEQLNLGSTKKMVARLPSEKEWIRAALGTQDTSQYSPEVNQLQMPVMLPRTSYDAWNIPAFSKKGVSIYNANINYHVSNTTAYPASFLDGYAYTAPVTEFPPNLFGIYNTVGNVAEMIGQPGKAKGGSWNNFIEECYLDKSQRNEGPDPQIGFRVVVQMTSN